MAGATAGIGSCPTPFPCGTTSPSPPGRIPLPCPWRWTRADWAGRVAHRSDLSDGGQGEKPKPVPLVARQLVKLTICGSDSLQNRVCKEWRKPGNCGNPLGEPYTPYTPYTLGRHFYTSIGVFEVVGRFLTDGGCVAGVGAIRRPPTGL